MAKKILYLDMDGVVADFDKAIDSFCFDLESYKTSPIFESRGQKVKAVCTAHPEIFHDLPVIEGAVEATKKLFELYEVYFLSTAMWNIPISFTGKRHWLEKHFGELATRRLILTPRKDLNIGDFLVDDRLKNGVTEFKGIHIHFGTPQFPNWEVTLKYLESVA
jgi:5'-nucleotidase